MNGYATQTDVALWLRLDRPGRVKIEYWKVSDPTSTQEREVRSGGLDNQTVQVILDGLEPGQEYHYRLSSHGREGWRRLSVINGARFRTQQNWQRISPPPDFRVAFGSCAYINDPPIDGHPEKPYGGGFHIFDAIADKAPDLMLWLGDAVYLRSADWGSPAGIYRRYRHARAFPQLRRLLSTTQNYAIWDDHDYGPNDSDRSYVHKGSALRTFKEFWGNPSYGLPDTPGVFGQFSWGDVDFFLLDGRYHRHPSNAADSEDKSQLGIVQFQWLIDALTSSKASFKVVVGGGQFLSPFDHYEGYAQFGHERDELLGELTKRKIEGVFFLSGDRHHAELVKIQPDNMYALFDFTSSPLTSRGAGADRELNSPVRVEGTLIRKKRNFGVLEFFGPPQNRQVALIAYDDSGKELWRHVLRAQELKF